MSHPQSRFARVRRLDRVTLSAVVAVAAVGAGCAGGVAPEVSPSEIPVLEARLAEAPNDGDLLLRYSAALYSAGQCDSATVIARRGMAVQPSKALGPLIVGQCMEAAEAYDDAVGVYQGFLASYPDARGSGAVRARETVARRDRALVTARQALAQEEELAQTPAEPTTVIVLGGCEADVVVPVDVEAGEGAAVWMDTSDCTAPTSITVADNGAPRGASVPELGAAGGVVAAVVTDPPDCDAAPADVDW